jgi:hypothetical protein
MTFIYYKPNIVNNNWPILVVTQHLRHVSACECRCIWTCSQLPWGMLEDSYGTSYRTTSLTSLLCPSVRDLSILSGKRRWYPGRRSILLDTSLFRSWCTEEPVPSLVTALSPYSPVDRHFAIFTFARCWCSLNLFNASFIILRKEKYEECLG